MQGIGSAVGIAVRSDAHQLELALVAETLVIHLYCPAVVSRKPRGLLHGDRAVRIIMGQVVLGVRRQGFHWWNRLPQWCRTRSDS
ncbi:hypothetical protein [Nocardia sp. NPDC004604]|uniref:hypothetical protein n=1 Tax=Nocardia sp. NPDC004604 TaxID=3157013 RepID=UPI0033B19343